MVKNVIVVSDTHCGCQLGLCPPEVKLDSGGKYSHSTLQAKVWQNWLSFWREWVPQVTKGEPYVIVHNGDVIDGVHHNSTTQISHNLKDQIRIAEEVLAPIVDNKKCKAYYHIRGTEAHVGKSAQDEEKLAASLGAEVDEIGNAARWELWLRMDGILVHFTHHVGTTSSAAYESTAVYKELVEAFVEAGRLGGDPPDVIVRSHRHRAFKVEVPAEHGNALGIVTPGWQLKTPFTYRIALGRSSTPQIGGFLIRCGDEDRIYSRNKVWQIQRSEEVRI